MRQLKSVIDVCCWVLVDKFYINVKDVDFSLNSTFGVFHKLLFGCVFNYVP